MSRHADDQLPAGGLDPITRKIRSGSPLGTGTRSVSTGPMRSANRPTKASAVPALHTASTPDSASAPASIESPASPYRAALSSVTVHSGPLSISRQIAPNRPAPGNQSRRSAHTTETRGSSRRSPFPNTERFQSITACSRSTTTTRPAESNRSASRSENPTPSPPTRTVPPSGIRSTAARTSNRSDSPFRVSMRKTPLAMISYSAPTRRSTNSPQTPRTRARTSEITPTE